MNGQRITLSDGALSLSILTLFSCSSLEGVKVKTPFSGKISLGRTALQGWGMGQSANLNIAKNKAELEARKALANK